MEPTDAKTVAVILGAGRPHRGEAPAPLQAVAEDRAVLQWVMDALSGRVSETLFVGGYHVDEISERFRGLRYVINAEWMDTGSVGSLFSVPLDESCRYLILYGDIVFDTALLDRVLEAGRGDSAIAVACDSTDRRDGETEPPPKEMVALEANRIRAAGYADAGCAYNAEFIGMMLLPQAVVRKLKHPAYREDKRLSRMNLSGLLQRLLNDGHHARAVAVGGERWAEINQPRDLAAYVFGTKAETLARLRSLVRKSEIGHQVSFSVGDWWADPGHCLAAIRRTFDRNLVVRSSALSEDGWHGSNAGAHLSLLDLPVDDEGRLRDAIERVIASYGDDDLRHQVLVQEFIGGTCLSGVVFTRTLSHGAPYYVVNYDDEGSTTISVTGSTDRHLKTWIAHRSLPSESAHVPAKLRTLMAAVREVEGLVGYDALDIEFAVSRDDDRVTLFQIRPLLVDHNRSCGNDDEVAALLKRSESLFDQPFDVPGIVGSNAMWGDMPDWNPAEILGTRPRSLAVSLYRYLVTDETWAQQRREYGYRDLTRTPLMRMVAGHPYIDIRASLNSFIPADLDEALAGRLIEHYQGKLIRDDTLHDKIEFEVAYTCLTLDFQSHSDELCAAGFSGREIEQIRRSLAAITNHAMARYQGDLDRLDILSDRFEQCMEASLPPLEKALLLLRDCREYGTLPFAHLARGAFVAVALLRSLVSRGVIDEGQEQAFLASLRTVAKEFAEEMAAISGPQDVARMVEKYGHLRPGTYEITSRTYREDAERVFAAREAPVRPVGTADFRWPESIQETLEQRLAELGVETTLPRVDAFLRATIEGRERAKFLFSRNLSAALDCLVQFGKEHDVDREALSHIALSDLERCMAGDAPAYPGPWLWQRAREGREMHRLSQSVELPPLLLRAEDLWGFHYPQARPTFVGHGVACGELCSEHETETASNLDGRIILLEQADPGYDWIFNHRIAGLVTAYGGANSHMAIRAAEFGLPAVLGVGTRRFEELARHKAVNIDADHCRIEVQR